MDINHDTIIGKYKVRKVGKDLVVTLPTALNIHEGETLVLSVDKS